MIHAGKLKLAQKLIDEGVDINLKYYKNHEGVTPVHQAITSGNYEKVQKQKKNVLSWLFNTLTGQGHFAFNLVLSGAELFETSPLGVDLRQYALLKGELYTFLAFFKQTHDLIILKLES